MYEKLFEPGRIGSMTLKNRGIMMPMATDMADRDGIPTPRQIRYYQERARGGLGMIITEYTGVDDIDSIPSIHNMRAARDYHIAPLEELTDAVHLYDCRIVAQIHHGGATSNPAFTGRQNLAPSPVPIADGRPVPKEMTLEDIRRIQGKFVDAAVRCQKAGYDAVELHGAHGYLIAQFFSKYYNRRTDAYGGSVENRCRFIAEIIEGIRARLGSSYPILVRMCGDEMTPVEGFLNLEDGIEIAKHLETLGIDAINISNGSARNGDANCEPFSYRSGWKKHVARAYREALQIPVIATNTIKDPDFAEQLLEEGVCDFVGLGRSQLADPDFMNKAKAGRSSEIRKCIGCLYCRERVLGGGLPIRCSVNARAAREIEFPIPDPSVRSGVPDPCGGAADPCASANGGGAADPCGANASGAAGPCGAAKNNADNKTVAVIGGGPAGMEAARVLALRGFRPVLFEKEHRLGGTLNIADKPPLKDKITTLTDTLRAQLEALEVEIRLGHEATPETVAALRPAGVIIAAGGSPIIPALPGIEEGLSSGTVVTAEDVITGKAAVRGSVCILGSGLTGLETAELLLANGARGSAPGGADTSSASGNAGTANNADAPGGTDNSDASGGADGPDSAGTQGGALSIVEMLPEIGPGIFGAIRKDELSRILPCEPDLYPGCRAVEVRPGFVTIENVATGERSRIPADTLVLAAGVKPADALADAFRPAFAKVRVVGDARRGGRIATAIREGFEAAYTF